MTWAVCLDERNGMRFGGRRQSRDRVLLEDLAHEAAGEPVGADASSLPLLEQAGVPAYACAPGEAQGLYFLELAPPEPLPARLDRLLIYRWNRRYPADVYFAADPAQAGFVRQSVQEFAGFSHEKITKEVWVR